MENNTGIDSLLYKVYIRDGRSSIITTDEADKYKKFIQVNKYVFPIVIILISLIFNSWLIFIVCFFNVWIEEGEYDSYKFKTKSGKPDKRYTKSQVHYANKSEYYEIAGRALSILWIYIAIRIIIFIIRYFI